MNQYPPFVDAPWILLTGAGASVPLGKDTTASFVARCRASLVGQDMGLFERIVEGIEAKQVENVVDIEIILDHLFALRRAVETLRTDSDIRAWLATPGALFGMSTGVVPRNTDIEFILQEREALREKLLDLVVDHYCDVDSRKAAHLYGPLFNLAHQEVPFFTLNYDSAIESAIGPDRLDLDLIDGFSQGAQPTWSAENFRNFRASPSGKTSIVLFKLHGSTTWGRREGQIVRLPPNLARNPSPYEHVIMYPSQTKLGIEGEPFGTAYGYLKECLSRTGTCVVIGTSFRDQEIVSVLADSLKRSRNLRLVVVDPEASASNIARKLGCSLEQVVPVKGRFGESDVQSQIEAAIRGY
jgi:hypothetical protein